MDENEQFTMEIPVMFVYFEKKEPNFKQYNNKKREGKASMYICSKSIILESNSNS